jgi:hypothetical protein
LPTLLIPDLIKEVAMNAVNDPSSHAPSAEPTGAPQIEWVPIGLVRPNPKNARTHSRKQIRRIAASIRQFGFLNPILVDDTDIVLVGHGRLEAARLEGLDHVPVVRFLYLTAAQKRAYLIADNKIAEDAGWDRQMLAIELGELIELLPAEGFDVSLTGFEAPEIDSLLADMLPSGSDPTDIVPQLPVNPTTRRGDLWQLREHRLLCGDARNPRDFARLMNGTSARRSFAIRPTICGSVRSADVGASDIPNLPSRPAKCPGRSFDNSWRRRLATAFALPRKGQSTSSVWIGATSVT